MNRKLLNQRLEQIRAAKALARKERNDKIRLTLFYGLLVLAACAGLVQLGMKHQRDLYKVHGVTPKLEVRK